MPIVVTCALGLAAVGSAAFAMVSLSPLIEGGGAGGADTKMVLYDGPRTVTPSLDARITVNGQPLFTYNAVVNHARENRGDYDVSTLTRTPMTYFDFDPATGAAEIDVEMADDLDLPEIKTAAVSPLAAGIKPKIGGRHVKFTITACGQYTLTFNGSPHRAVHIFANAIETDVPDRNDPDVVWIDPGEWNIPDGIQLQSGQTLYISGGAVAHTTVSAGFAENVSIKGRGMIDGSNRESWQGTDAHVPVDFRYCKNVSAEGIIIHNSNAWVFNMFEVDGGTADNVKIISARPNGDGFTLQSCRDVNVYGGFVRTWDDSCVVKNYEGNTNNIKFSNMNIWTDLAQSMEIGYETNKGQRQDSTITNVTFENITVINAFHKPVMSIHNSDDATVSGILYRGITVENANMGGGDAKDNKQLIDLTIAPSTWNSTKERGKIRDVTFENINVLAGTSTPPLRFAGYDEEHGIDGVSIKNLTIFGKEITALDELSVSMKYAKNISLTGGAEGYDKNP